MIYDFFINNGFVFELLICNVLFALTLKRKSYFLLRIIIGFVILLGVSFFWSMFDTRYTIWDMVKFSTYIFIATTILKFSFDISIKAALFCEIGAFAMQHSGFKFGELLLFPFGNDLNQVTYAIIYISSLLLVYGILYYVFARQLKKHDVSHIENKQVIYLSMALLVFTVIIQYYYTDNISLYLSLAFYDLISCLLILWIQYYMIDSAKKEQDFKVMEHVLYLKTRQMELSKENMDLINIKVHDLKHQIKRYKDRLSAQEIDELQNALSIYDMSIKTGNDALDTVLAEKSLLCGKEKIKMNCIADGNSLKFMHASDIYSLFGNAIDNAISAVRQIDDNEKRIIAISVKGSANMVIIHFENFYTGGLLFEDNLPLTTNKEKKYHGFGLKSIRLLTEKYGGYISLKTDNNVFSLNILIPLDID